MKVFRISGRDVVQRTCRHRGQGCLNESLPHKRKRPYMFGRDYHVGDQASMKVFRISGRDQAAFFITLLIVSCSASMKVFRISGRDFGCIIPTVVDHLRLNESLPHKRKRRRDSYCVKAGQLLRLNESLPHKRKRPVKTMTKRPSIAGLNESLPHKRKRPASSFW